MLVPSDGFVELRKGGIMSLKDRGTAAVRNTMQGIHAGESKLAIREAAHERALPIALESPAFADGSPIPTEYTADGSGVSPPLRWGELPERTRELVLLCEDPDAPRSTPFVHWALYGIPPNVHDLAAASPTVPGREGKNSILTEGWTPPSPPREHGLHHYHFELFALDAPLSIADGAGRGAIVSAIRGHVLAKGDLVGTYQRG